MKKTSLLALLLLILPLATVIDSPSHAGSNNATTTGRSNTAVNLDDARHLLSRTGIGATPTEINQILDLNRVQAVNNIVAGLRTKAQIAPPAWTENPAPYYWAKQELTNKDRQKFNRIRLNEMQSLKHWWVREMISTNSPQTERLLLLWHNHFVTAYSGVNLQTQAIARQHKMLREQGSGNFRTLLKSIIRDPAMLNYLDNNGSRKVKPNENLARELLELFTLGEGNYTEQDIKNAARALTGYSFSESYDYQFVYKHWNHDTNEKTIFNQTGNFNGDDLIDLILTKPAAARHIAAMFWRVYVGDIDVDSATLTPHAAVFRESNYDIKTLYKSILLSDEFWDISNRANIIKSPVSLTIGTIRSTAILPTDWQTLPAQLSQMGQTLFDPPNVAGWPGGEAWISTGRLLTRLAWLEKYTDGSDIQKPAPNNMNTMSATEPSMQSENSITAMNSNMGGSNLMNSNSSQLTIHLASEEFDEPAKYQVEVFGNNTLLWSSGELALNGGHDTKRMGRLSRANMPWQMINFPININENDINAIEVSFLNDGTTPNGADRNLYVNRAVFGNKIWSPTDGKQTGKCARKKPNQQGNLYCNGTLRMEKFTEAAVAQNQVQQLSTLEDNTFSTSGVFLNFVHPPKRKPRAELVIRISDVEFNGRYWNSMSVKYIKDKDGYAIWMSNHDCWPRCLDLWPECSWVQKASPENKTVSLSLTSQKESSACMYDGLNPADQQLANALWTLADDFYAAAANSAKMDREKQAANYNAWKPNIESMQQQALNSKYYDNSIKLEVTPRPLIDQTLTDIYSAPIPGSTTHSDWQSDFQQLQLRAPNTSLSSLLLSARSAQAAEIANNKQPHLKSVLTDLTYQLK